jgi:RNA polymerase sigma-70 factor, ECF subfamily
LRAEPLPNAGASCSLATSGLRVAFFDGTRSLSQLLHPKKPEVGSAVRRAPAQGETELIRPGATIRMTNFADLYRSYFDFVWSSARYLGVEGCDMDDVVQDVFITIHKRLDTLQRPSSLRSWIYGITRRIASAYHRTKRTALIAADTVHLEPELLQPERASPLRMAERSEQAELLWNLLEELEPSKRETIVLAELHELTAPEIAAAIDVPLNTVYSRLRAARRELEEALLRRGARDRWRARACAD